MLAMEETGMHLSARYTAHCFQVPTHSSTCNMLMDGQPLKVVWRQSDVTEFPGSPQYTRGHILDLWLV